MKQGVLLENLTADRPEDLAFSVLDLPVLKLSKELALPLKSALQYMDVPLPGRQWILLLTWQE